jgi:hypothetical protein
MMMVRRSGFAIWNVRRNLAFALDAYPDEIKPSQQSLASAQGLGETSSPNRSPRSSARKHLR